MDRLLTAIHRDFPETLAEAAENTGISPEAAAAALTSAVVSGLGAWGSGFGAAAGGEGSWDWTRLAGIVAAGGAAGYLAWRTVANQTGKGSRRSETKLLNSLIVALPRAPSKARAARDFVRFYTSPNPLLFLATKPSAKGDVPMLKPIRPRSPLPNGDFNQEVITRHYRDFRERITSAAREVGLDFTEEAWSELMHHLSVNTLIEVMLSGRRDSDDPSTATWPATPGLPGVQNITPVANLREPTFIIAMTPPRGGDPGGIRVVTYAKAGTGRRQEMLQRRADGRRLNDNGLMMRVWSDLVGAAAASSASASASASASSSSPRTDSKVEGSVEKKIRSVRLMKREMVYGNFNDLRALRRDLFDYQRPEVLEAIAKALSPKGIMPGLIEHIAHYVGLHSFYSPGFNC